MLPDYEIPVTGELAPGRLRVWFMKPTEVDRNGLAIVIRSTPRSKTTRAVLRILKPTGAPNVWSVGEAGFLVSRPDQIMKVARDGDTWSIPERSAFMVEGTRRSGILHGDALQVTTTWEKLDE